jgi:hypothetical protein
MIPVLEDTARDILHLCFEQYGMDSLPFTVSSNFYQWMDEMSTRAGLSREFGFRALRRTFGTTLIRKGFTSEEVAEYLGLYAKHKTKPLYDALNEPVDWDTRPAGSLSDADVVDALQRLSGHLDRRPMMDDIEEHFQYSYQTLYNRFGGLHDALDAAGIYVPKSHPQAIRPEKLLNELRRLAEELGHPPVSKEMADRGRHSASLLFDHFGDWDAAIEAAGLDPKEIPSTPGRKISRENLLQELRRLADELDRSPRIIDLRQKGRYSYQPYYSTFGGIREAREAAGVGHS